MEVTDTDLKVKKSHF